MRRLDRLMDIAARSLKTKRTVITKLLDEGLYPYTKRYLGTFANHFSTIGLVGMNEAALNAKWIQKDMTAPAAQQFTQRVLNHMRERLSDYQEQYGDLYNLEATPAESTAYRFAKHDKEQYPDIVTANEHGTPLLHQQLAPARRLHGGRVRRAGHPGRLADAVHVGHGVPRLPRRKAARLEGGRGAGAQDRRKLQAPLLYLSPTYSVCKDHGYLSGEQFVCPKCGGKTEVYSRITGYYRPVQNWNDGKAQEFKDRKV